MKIKDDFVRGFVAGLAGGLVSLLINGGTSLLGLNTVMWAEIMSRIILGHFPKTVAQYAFSFSTQLIFLGVLGVLFSLILPVIKPEHLYFKGAVFGASIWYVLFSLPHLLHFSELSSPPLPTAIANLSAALAWGVTLAFMLKWLGNSTNTQKKTQES